MLKVKYIQIVIPVKFGLEEVLWTAAKINQKNENFKIYKNMFFGVNTAMRL